MVPASSWQLRSNRSGSYSVFWVKKTMEVEILKRSGGVRPVAKMDSARALVEKDGNSSGQPRHERVACAAITAGEPFCRLAGQARNRRNDEADAEILSGILDIISDMPSYGYRRVGVSCVSNVV